MRLRMLFLEVDMNRIKLLYHYFSRLERTLAASLIGVTSLVFNAKGNPFGQLLMVVCFMAFFVNDIYGYVSWRRMERRQAELTSTAK